MAFELGPDAFREFTDARNFGAKGGVIEHFLDFAQTVGPFDEAFAGQRTGLFFGAAAAVATAIVRPGADAAATHRRLVSEAAKGFRT